MITLAWLSSLIIDWFYCLIWLCSASNAATFIVYARSKQCLCYVSLYWLPPSWLMQSWSRVLTSLFALVVSTRSAMACFECPCGYLVYNLSYLWHAAVLAYIATLPSLISQVVAETERDTYSVSYWFNVKWTKLEISGYLTYAWSLERSLLQKLSETRPVQCHVSI